MRVAPAGVAAGASTAAAREVFAAVVKKSTFSADENVDFKDSFKNIDLLAQILFPVCLLSICLHACCLLWSKVNF